MKYKIIFMIFLFGMLFSGSASAATVDVATGSAEDITYYSATLNGSVSAEDVTISSYGIEIWADDIASMQNQCGTGNYAGAFSCTLYLLDETTYYYRAYAKDTSSKYHYGITSTFKTKAREIEESPTVDFNIPVESLDTISFADTPNKFLLNNLILNKKDTLQLIAGNNFDGIEGIQQAGGENIFINQYFINEYYSDPLLAPLLGVFDVAVYNRGDFVLDAAVSLGETVFYVQDRQRKLLLPDNLYGMTRDETQKAFNDAYSDMRIKRFTNAINNVLTNEYTSSDKRTFGYDQAMYGIFNSSSKIAKGTDELLDNYKEGKETIIEGIEQYQAEYFENIGPAYLNAKTNFLGMNEYLIKNSKNMTSDELASNLQFAHEYSEEIATHEVMDYANETVRSWKIGLQTNYYGKKINNFIESYGEAISFSDSMLGTVNTLEQVYVNHEQLYGVFDRLRSTTDNEKLKLTLDNYIEKMDNILYSFIKDTAANVFDTFAKEKVQKMLGEEVVKVGKRVASEYFSSYSSFAVDKALGKANAALIAADIGGIFAEKISSTKTVLEKAIEAKYLWNLENESKELLQRDLLNYAENQTEENAEAVIRDLYWIKALKLRSITVTKQLYNANGDNWLALANSNLGVISDYIDEIFVSQRDALVGASLSETEYTGEALVLEDGETFMVGADGSGSILTDDGGVLLSNASGRLAGGVVLKNGSSLILSVTDTTVYIPYVTMSSGSELIIDSGKVIIDEFVQGNGTVYMGENCNVEIMGDLTLSCDLSLKNGSLVVGGKFNHTNKLLDVSNGTFKVTGNCDLRYSTFKAGSGKTEIGGNFTTYGLGGFYMQDDQSYMLVNGNFQMSGKGASETEKRVTAGTLEIEGDFRIYDYGSDVGGSIVFNAQGTHRVILSGTGEQTVYFESIPASHFNILEIKNQSGKIKFNSTIPFNELVGDLYYTGNLSMYTHDREPILNCKNIKGDRLELKFYGGKLNLADEMILEVSELETYVDINIGNGFLKVNGNLKQTFSAVMNVGNGVLEVTGDYNTAGDFYAGNGTTKVLGDFWMDGIFSMESEQAYVFVNGDFQVNNFVMDYNSDYYDYCGKRITAGILEIKGDFIQRGSVDRDGHSFTATGTHKVILSGTKEQKVYFANPTSSYFNILINRNPHGVVLPSNVKYSQYKVEYPIFNIAFVTNCDVVIEPLQITYGKKLEKPEDVTNSEMFFVGWYVDEALTTAYDFDAEVRKDLTLYAKWTNREYQYTVTDSVATIAGIYGFRKDDAGILITDITLPTEIDGYPVTSIAASAFSGAEITSITVPVGITTIEEKAFENCTSLTSAKILGVETMGTNVFNGCSVLTNVEIHGTGATKLSNSLGSCEKLTDVIIGDGVQSFWSSVLPSKSLSNISIGKDVTSLAGNTFNNITNLKNINISEDNANYTSENGILYSKDKTILIAYPRGKENASFAIPEGVTEIGAYAFYQNQNIAELTLPESLTTIKNMGICLCNSLQSLHLPKFVQTLTNEWIRALNLTEITVDKDNPYFISVDGVLYNKDMTKLFKYPSGKTGEYYKVTDTVTEVAPYGFYFNKLIRNIDLPDSVTTIGNAAFARCTSLESLVIPKNVTTILNSMFLGDASLKYVYIPNAVTKITSAFNNCTVLTNIYYEGTSEEWETITISGTLPANAQVKCNCIYASDMAKIYNADGVTSFEITPDEEYAGKQIICAMYNGNELSDKNITEYDGTAIEWSSQEPFTEIKIMIWNDLVSNTPARKALEISN